MKGKDKKTLATKTVAELEVLLQEKRSELARVEMELAQNKVKNVHAGRQLHNDIAVIETIKRMRQNTEEGQHA